MKVSLVIMKPIFMKPQDKKKTSTMNQGKKWLGVGRREGGFQGWECGVSCWGKEIVAE